jgi:outer membrane protein assembly factor BamB
MRVLALVLLMTAGCQEYGVNPHDDDATAPDGDDGTGTDGYDTGIFRDGEFCNGEDDDGDGEVDEGFRDLDGDGIKDCVDGDCTVRTPEGYATEIDWSCGGSPPEVEEPWNAVIEWQWTGLPTDASMAEVTTTPVIGNLTDDNFDGIINELDIPEIVVVAFDDDELTGHLLVLDGETGTELWWDEGYTAFGGPALADIDGDLVTDIVAFDIAGYVVALDNTGGLIWKSAIPVSTDYPQATVADVDGDGRAEVIADTLLLDGRTGKLLANFPISSTIAYRMPAVADLDLNGTAEIIIGNNVYAPDGTRLWGSTQLGTYGHWSVILDVDGDAQGEVVMIGGAQMAAFDPDGTKLWQVGVPQQVGPPCAADFDGDGYPEIGWSSGNSFNLHELDGTQIWTRPVVDDSGLSGCSGFDFDADSVYEIVYSDEHTLMILDGETGSVRFSQTGHASGTIWEYPTVGDVDGDGSAELVLVSNNRWAISGWAGVTVFGHADDEWPRSGSTWHVHDFAVTNVLPNGVVPAHPIPSWQVHNLYRARPWDDEAGVDLQGIITDVCFTGCVNAAKALVSVQVINTGNIDSKAYVPLSLFSVYEGGALELLDVMVIEEPLQAGWVTDAMVFEVPAHSVAEGLLLRVDDNGSGGQVQHECDEENNDAEWLDSPPC